MASVASLVLGDVSESYVEWLCCPEVFSLGSLVRGR